MRLQIQFSVGVTTTLLACGVEPLDRLAFDPEVARGVQAISLGQDVPAQDFPAVAALRYGYVTVGVTCTGTLIAPTWVLTAAHCARGAAGMEVGGEDPGSWAVYFGDEDLNDGSDPAPYAVKAVRVNPDWNTNTLILGRADVALLELARPVTGVAPMPVLSNPIPDGTDLTLVGFGRATAMPMVESELSGILRMGENRSIPCADVPFDDSRPQITNEFALCVDTERAPGSCARDSGGPALVREGSGYALAGVVSGSRNTNLGACGEFGIYAQVAKNQAFISQYVKSTTPTPGNPAGAAKGDSSTSRSRDASGCSPTGATPDFWVLVAGLAWAVGQKRRPTAGSLR